LSEERAEGSDRADAWEAGRGKEDFGAHGELVSFGGREEETDGVVVEFNVLSTKTESRSADRVPFIPSEFSSAEEGRKADADGGVNVEVIEGAVSCDEEGGDVDKQVFCDW